MSIFTCFGYGSLVNVRTLLPGTEVRSARVRGWRRAWRLSGDSTFGNRCTLTVVPDEGAAILGVMVVQHADHRAALSAREVHYVPTPLSADSVEWLDPPGVGWPDAFIHVGRPEYVRAGGPGHPVMMSYLDVVIAGFRGRFGDEGAEHFVDTTLDWHVPVLNDRASPRYPRWVPVEAADRAFVDALVRRMPLTVIDSGAAAPPHTPSVVSVTR